MHRIYKLFRSGGWLRNVEIEARLRLASVGVLLLMFAGFCFSYWNLVRVQAQVSASFEADRQLTAALRINNRFLVLLDRLHAAGDSKRAEQFESEARQFKTAFEADVASSANILKVARPNSDLDQYLLESVTEAVDAMPNRLELLRQLAQAGDWDAVSGRLQDVLFNTNSVADALVRDSSVILARSQSALFQDLATAQRRAAAVLALCSILSIFAATGLALSITRSITEPLKALRRGARALARGDFEHRIDIDGEDELAHLSAVFNQTSSELGVLYGQLRQREKSLQQLLVTEKQARKTAELLNQAGLVFSAELDAERLAPSLIHIASQLIGAKAGVFLYRGDRDGQERFFYAGDDLKAAEQLRALGQLLPAGHGHEEILTCADGNGQPLDSSHKSVLAIPVTTRSRETGVLLFGHPEPGVFSQREIDALKGVRAQFSVALENAHLFDQVKWANQDLLNVNNALKRANDDLSVFAYSGHHDLQEPIRNVGLCSQMLEKLYGTQLDAEANDLLRQIFNDSKRMAELVKGILSYIQVSDSGGTLPVSEASTAMQDALQMLQGVIRADSAAVGYGPLPQVAVEHIPLQQLFQNLIGNAIKYRGTEAPQIQISARPEGDFWCFSVQDNGIGIHPSYLTTIFSPFKRLHDRTKHSGTGIGLAICKRITERYGGRIWVESLLGVGSTFKFTLPKVNNISELREVTANDGRPN